MTSLSECLTSLHLNSGPERAGHMSMIPDLRSFGVTSSTRVFAVLGDPVAHSRSPVFQQAALRAKGLDAVYVALRVAADELAPVALSLAASGGGGNVTLPHKERMAALVERPSDAVRRTGACNTFWFEEGQLAGDNTDVVGVQRSVDRLLGQAPTGTRVLVVGAGGAARAAAVALLDAGAGELEVGNRTTSRAEQLVADLSDPRLRVVDLTTCLTGGSYDLVINATRLGLHAEDPFPVALESPEQAGAVLDMVYNHPQETRWVQHLKGIGINATDGREMLLQQGAAAFERWWSMPAPIEAMRLALEGG